MYENTDYERTNDDNSEIYFRNPLCIIWDTPPYHADKMAGMIPYRWAFWLYLRV